MLLAMWLRSALFLLALAACRDADLSGAPAAAAAVPSVSCSGLALRRAQERARALTWQAIAARLRRALLGGDGPAYL